jgi:hypothetical protein
MANRTQAASRDNKSIIYVIAGGLLAIGLLMMTFYDRASAPETTPIIAVQK